MCSKAGNSVLEQIHKVQLTEQISQSGCTHACVSVCVRPPAQLPQQNKLNSESLNYAALKVLGVFFSPFQRQGSVIIVVLTSSESQEE